MRAVFFGLGADGTVGANKNTIKIIGDERGPHAQGYFVYDSKKSGSQTVSHLRFGPQPIRAPYLVQPGELHRLPPVRVPRAASTCSTTPRPARRCCSTAAHPPDEVWDALPRAGAGADHRQAASTLYVIDADRVAREAGLGGRTNTVLQTCFFAISGVLPREEAIERIKDGDREDLRPQGAEVVDAERGRGRPRARGLHRIEVPERVDGRPASCCRSCPRTRRSSCAT